MYTQLLSSLLLFACQIIMNESSVIIHKNVNSVRTTNRKIPSATQSSSLPEGYVTFPDVHAAYKLHEVGKTWNQARDLCAAEGAHLAIAETEKKIAHIKSLRTHQKAIWTHAGIYHSNTTGQWVRIDNGLPLKSLPWLGGNPGGDGDCVGIAIWTKVLLDYDCDSHNEWFACEISL